jgi:uncharacterized protein
MTFFAQWVTKRLTAWLIVSFCLVSGLWAALEARHLKQEDDLLAFLPPDSAEVKLFNRIHKRFGGMDVALVGLESEDLFSTEFLTRLDNLTERLDDLSSLDHVLSLSNVIDFTPDDDRGGVVTAPLVDKLPQNDADKKVLRAKVMSRSHIVGNLVGADGQAVVILCYLAYGVNPKEVARRIKEVVGGEMPHAKVFWGGGPFVSSYIFATTQKDLKRLTPWAVLAIIVVMMLSFRDVWGTLVVLLSTGLGIVIVLGAMQAMGVGFNLVLSSTPVVLFAIGSAYGLHVLAHYYDALEKDEATVALQKTLEDTGPVVLAAGLTTAASLFSFVAMDIVPVRIFGIFTALGIVVVLVLSLTLVPALIHLLHLRRPAPAQGPVARLSGRLAMASYRHRRVLSLVVATVGIVALSLALQVDSTVDMTTFFSDDSPPARSATFLQKHFGGSDYLQVNVQGDMNEPHVLRRVRHTADQIAQLANVAAVMHVGEAVALTNNAMTGQRRIPDTPAQLRLLYSFLMTDPATNQLLTPQRQEALMHIKVSTDRSHAQEELIDQIKEIVSKENGAYHIVSIVDPTSIHQQLRHTWLERIFFLAHHHGIKMQRTHQEAMRNTLSSKPATVTGERIRNPLLRYLRSLECALDVRDLQSPDPGPALSQALVALGHLATEEELLAATSRILQRDDDDDEVADLVFSLVTPLREMWALAQTEDFARKVLGAGEVEIPNDARGQRFVDAVTMTLLDRNAPTLYQRGRKDPGALRHGTVTFAVSGLPVMHQGLSRSVTRNQILSLAMALVMVWILMMVFFRSWSAGTLALSPTLLTIALIYGGMGLFGVHLDLGTSMLASIVVGAGVDYAVHLVSAWQGDSMDDAVKRAAQTTGAAIWTNALMVAVGFSVLTLGEARPLQNVGGLTAAAMIVAATTTFICVPIFARRRFYRN